MSAGSLPKSEGEDDKVSLLSAEYDPHPPNRNEVISTGPSVKVQTQDYLDVPRTGPLRPLSPDTLSNFSADDPDQSRPIRRGLPLVLGGGRRHGSSILPAPPKTWRGRWDAFWTRNKGLVLMVFAQVFTVLMSVTTRLLEIEGNEGKGLHPFQVGTINLKLLGLD